jgi:hypothetical protein
MAKADPVPSHEGLRVNNRDSLEPSSWVKNNRSPFVSWTRSRAFRRNIISCCRITAFSASSRLFDLNGETNRARRKENRAIIAADVRRFVHAINTDEVHEAAKWTESQGCDRRKKSANL